MLLLLLVMVHMLQLFGSNCDFCLIRHPAVAGSERDTRDAMAESWFGYDGAEHYELEWDVSMQNAELILMALRGGAKSLAAVAARLSGTS